MKSNEELNKMSLEDKIKYLLEISHDKSLPFVLREIAAKKANLLRMP